MIAAWKEAVGIDWLVVIGGVIVALTVFDLLSVLFERLVKKFGIETKSMREKRENLELLKSTADLASATSENVDKLKEHYEKQEAFRKKFDKHVDDSEKDRRELHSEMKQFTENRKNDRAQSFEIQRQLVNAQKEISKSVDALTDRVSQNEDKQNRRVQAEIKDKIAQLYRKYSEVKTISRMELEALEDLISTYEEHGGENSFVHSKVQLEMYTWKVTE